MQWMFMNFAGHGIEKMVNSYFGVSRPFLVRIKWEAQWRVNKHKSTNRQADGNGIHQAAGCHSSTVISAGWGANREDRNVTAGLGLKSGAP